jgi:4-hydroxy-tetrahydrodipicolinate reductase
MPKKLKVCVGGATGWAGSAIARAILKSQVFELSGALARQGAGKDLGEILGVAPTGIGISSTLSEALERRPDIWIDYTKPDTVKANTLTALGRGVRVVIGASGLTAADYQEIDGIARRANLGVIAAGNFSITAALAKHFSLLAARYLPQWEILDYAHDDKIDVPSGTSRELAEQMMTVRPNTLGRQISELVGPREARGAQIGGTPVHSIRLASYMVSFETIFGLKDERLTIRHDSGAGAEPYVAGTLLAAERVMETIGLVRGLDTLLFSA